MKLTEINDWVERKLIDSTEYDHKYLEEVLKLIQWHIDTKNLADDVINEWARKMNE